MSHLYQLQYVLGCPSSTAVIRQLPEDFFVSEELIFEPSGKGQHVYLFIEKQNLNTETVASQLAQFVGVRQVAIGYAGLKDRNAVTRQWFSVDLAGKPEPDWTIFNSELIQVIEVIRHDRKLKRGAIRANHFKITLRQFSGDQQELQQRLEYIRQNGVPNYYGGQRFGRDDNNLKQFDKLVSSKTKQPKRHLRGLYLSAARSYLFNLVLSQRVADKTWDTPVSGDVFMLEGSHSVFKVNAIDEEIVERIKAFDIHPTAPLWGSGKSMASENALATETQVLESHQAWRDFLEKASLKQERRAMRVKVDDLQWEWVGGDLVLGFKLPTGSYATAVLRELVLYG